MDNIEKNYLFTIGIDNYTNCNKLKNAVKDAKDISSLLIDNFQFEEEFFLSLYDEEATSDRILEKLDFLIDNINENDTLIIYYAGHGHYDKKIDIGYWIPVNAKSRFASDYIHHNTIIKHIKSIKAKHIVLISDSCFSGTIFEETRSVYLDKNFNIASRWCLTSGRNEVVGDGPSGQNSPFAKAIIDFLKKRKSKEILIRDLISYVEENVTNNTSQMPMGNRLGGLGDKGGQFVFRKKNKLNGSMDKKSKVEEINYESPSEILLKIDKTFSEYFSRVFRFNEDDNIDTKKQKIKEIIELWENNIATYCSEFKNAFNKEKLELYDNPSYYQDFKTKVFGKKLWTVSSALHTRELELLRYKKAYATVQPKVLFSSFKNILNQVDEYVQVIGRDIKFDNISNIDDLKQGFFENESMLLRSIIGRGIRSEIIHRLYPSIFPIMTRKSQWGMFFLSDNSSEFITYEKGTGKERKGKTRLTNQYQYNYPRFNYYNNEIVKRLSTYLKPYGILLKDEIRFGYANDFLGEIDSLNLETRQELTTWK